MDLSPLAGAPDALMLVKESWLSGVYRIEGDGRVFGHLTYAKLTGRCVAEASGASWTFGRPRGLLHGHQQVFSAAGEQIADLDLAAWHHGGAIDWAGTPYRIDETGFGSTTLSVSSADGVLFTVLHELSFRSKKATVRLTDNGRADAGTPLLLVLGVNMMISAQGGFGGAAVPGGPAITNVITSLPVPADPPA